MERDLQKELEEERRKVARLDDEVDRLTAKANQAHGYLKHETQKIVNLREQFLRLKSEIEDVLKKFEHIDENS